MPIPRGGCHHRIAPSGGDPIVAMKRLYHASAASSTLHPASLRYPHPTRLSLMNESCRDRKNAFSYTIQIYLPYLLFWSCTSPLRIIPSARESGTIPRFTTERGGRTMLPCLFFY